MKKQILLIMLLLANTNQLLSQVSWLTNSSPSNPAHFLGWDVTAGSPDLFIKHELDQPIRFYTDAANGTGTLNFQRMIIDASPGHVGIGLNFSPGNDALDILPDVNFPRTGYGINNQTVLHNYGTGNISVGVGAGQAIIFGGIENTNVGYNAGNAVTTGRENTLVGANAGLNLSTGSCNTFIGANAGSAIEVTHAIAIGNNTQVNCDNCTVIGGDKVGIGTAEPQATLDVNGTIQAKQIMVLNNGRIEDLLALVTQLQNEIALMRQQLTVAFKN